MARASASLTNTELYSSRPRAEQHAPQRVQSNGRPPRAATHSGAGACAPPSPAATARARLVHRFLRPPPPLEAPRRGSTRPVEAWATIHDSALRAQRRAPRALVAVCGTRVRGAPPSAPKPHELGFRVHALAPASELQPPPMRTLARTPAPHLSLRRSSSQQPIRCAGRAERWVATGCTRCRRRREGVPAPRTAPLMCTVVSQNYSTRAPCARLSPPAALTTASLWGGRVCIEYSIAVPCACHAEPSACTDSAVKAHALDR